MIFSHDSPEMAVLLRGIFCFFNTIWVLRPGFRAAAPTVAPGILSKSGLFRYYGSVDLLCPTGIFPLSERGRQAERRKWKKRAERLFRGKISVGQLSKQVELKQPCKDADESPVRTLLTSYAATTYGHPALISTARSVCDVKSKHR